MAAEVARRRAQQAQQQGAARGGGAGPAAGVEAAAPGGAGGHAFGSSGSELDDDGGYAGYASSSDASGSSDEGGSSEEGGSSGSEGGPARGGGGGGHSDAVLPLRLELEGLELVDCDALELLRLTLQVACTRCRAAGELSFASAAVALLSDGGAGRGGRRGTLAAAAECGNCHQPWAAEVAPKLLHDRNNVLAHVRADGCAPQDLLPSWLAGQCSRCASSAAFRGAAVGRWNERACSACHTPMRFQVRLRGCRAGPGSAANAIGQSQPPGGQWQCHAKLHVLTWVLHSLAPSLPCLFALPQFSTALFVPNKPGGAPRQGAAGGSGPRPQGGPRSRVGGAVADPYSSLLVQPGTELLDRGTCKHYR